MIPETNERQSFVASRRVVSISFMRVNSDPSTCQHVAHHMWSKAIGLPVSLSEKSGTSKPSYTVLLLLVDSERVDCKTAARRSTT